MPGLDVGAPGVRVTEVDPKISRLPRVATDKCGMVGVTERGRLGPFEANSFDEWVNEYGGFTTDSLDMAVAAMGYYDNGGKSLTTIRTVHYTDLTDPTTKASVAASVNIDTTSTQTYGSVTMGVAAPVRLDPADTLIFSIERIRELGSMEAIEAEYARANFNPPPLTIIDDDPVDCEAVETVHG